ncbi:hypothetical protein B7H23_01370 [Notoacmeibacter marinus]|uniref:MobA/VirD2-like nuclease domain-containing protein n=1 Tax=Notoacmeibacter marinus TaxID=1876515 RepID=A0A231V0J3_9HYPH|nr:hypothetical protein [Notoacmeibacter marinus]OXT01650.1 hypothetical protein B7H23_01370 [Notoacmeibacter marinus]
MILKGNQRAGASELAAHLLNLRDNDHVTVHELRGFVAGDLEGAFNEAYAVSRGTKCRQFLFSLSLNPPETADVPVEAFERAISRIENRLKLSGQPRAIIFHEKNGRRHAHCVWSRIDTDAMIAINLPHYKMKLRDIARALYHEHQWEMPPGLVHAKDRDPLNLARQEWQQALRVEKNPRKLKQLFLSSWETSDSRASFEAALSDQGFYLARGDRRGYIAVDRRGEVYSLSRWTGRKTNELKARLGPAAGLRSIEETKNLIAEHLSDTATEIQAAAQKRKADRRARYQAARAELVERQRLQRRQLAKRQGRRASIERKERQARMPTGLRALWSRLTGAYKALQKEIEQEAAACNQRDQLEQTELIWKQLRERRDLKERLRRQDRKPPEGLEALFAEIQTRQSQLRDAHMSETRKLSRRRRPS